MVRIRTALGAARVALDKCDFLMGVGVGVGFRLFGQKSYSLGVLGPCE